MARFSSASNLMRPLVVPLALLPLAVVTWAQQPIGEGWPTYGGDPGGQRYSSATQINEHNVAQLQLAWTAHTGALDESRATNHNASFEATPVLFKGTLYLSTPFAQVLALDPATGARKWIYEPWFDKTYDGGLTTSRGVTAWSSKRETGPCSNRIFVGTLNAKLIALDAQTGRLCAGFGGGGVVDLTRGVRPGNLQTYARRYHRSR